MTKCLSDAKYLGAVSLLACLAAQPAVAQTASAGRADTGSGGQVSDIIVTAQKRSENVQRVPAAVTALGGELLVRSGVSDLVAVQNYVPSVRFQTQGSAVEIYIRGIGQTYEVPNSEPPTAFNFNGIYLARELASQPMYDIARVEVLPGPQGTLYGRSALGGAVNIITERPSDSLETKGVVELGNYDLVHVTGIQNLPVSDKMSVRAAVDYTNRDGYLKTGAGAVDALSGRLSFLIQPTDNFTAFLFGQHTRGRGAGQNLVNKGFNPNTFQIDRESFLKDDPWDDRLDAQYTGLSGPVRAVPKRYNGTILGGQFDLDVGDDATITFIPSYGKLRYHDIFYITALLNDLSYDLEQYSGELRASGNTGNLNWVVGLNAYRATNSVNQRLSLGPIPLNFYDTTNRSKGLGAFVHLTYSLSDSLRLLAGGRYSDDSRKGFGLATDSAGLNTIPWENAVSSSRFDWKAGIEYDVAPRVMAYAIAQSGYQPATYNAAPSTPTASALVDAPTITAFTAGLKGRFLDNKLQVNTEAFYYIYKGLPLQAFDLQLQLNAIFNAERVEIYGNQLDVVFQPTANDNLKLSVGYLHARQTDAVTPSGLDVSGLQMQNAPDWTISAGYSHDFQFSGGYLRAAVDSRYESSFFGDYLHTVGARQKAYTMTNASLTFNSNDKWSIGVWIKNIENEAVQASTASGGIPGPVAAALQAPRTFGLRATFGY